MQSLWTDLRYAARELRKPAVLSYDQKTRPGRCSEPTLGTPDTQVSSLISSSRGPRFKKITFFEAQLNHTSTGRSLRYLSLKMTSGC
jgi:hypothetical protein